MSAVLDYALCACGHSKGIHNGAGCWGVTVENWLCECRLFSQVKLICRARWPGCNGSDLRHLCYRKKGHLGRCKCVFDNSRGPTTFKRNREPQDGGE